MKSLRKPNGSDRERLFATDLLNMEVGGKYAYACRARTLKHAIDAVGGTQRLGVDDDTKIIVHTRFNTTEWGWVAV